MIVKAYRTAKFEKVDEIRCNRILCASADPKEAKECCDNDWTPMLSLELPDGASFQFIPVYFVIEIREE